MINIKYLIVSLASVFLALGIGIFIGLSFDGQEIILEQQEALIDEIEHKFAEIRNENEELKEEINNKNIHISHYEIFTRDIFPSLIQSKLEDINVAVIETNESYTYEEIPSVVESAGGEVVSRTFIKKEFLLNEEEILDDVYNYFIKEKKIKANKEDISVILPEQLIIAILENDITTLEYLEEAGIISLEGAYNSNIDYFIVAGGGTLEDQEDVIKKIDIPLIESIKGYIIPVAGIEQSYVEKSYINEYMKQNISTIDNVDTLMGQYSLIEVINGKNGDYGIKESAEELIPW